MIILKIYFYPEYLCNDIQIFNEIHLLSIYVQSPSLICSLIQTTNWETLKGIHHEHLNQQEHIVGYVFTWFIKLCLS